MGCEWCFAYLNIVGDKGGQIRGGTLTASLFESEGVMRMLPARALPSEYIKIIVDCPECGYEWEDTVTNLINIKSMTCGGCGEEITSVGHTIGRTPI